MRVRQVGLALLALTAACSEDGNAPTEFPSGAAGRTTDWASVGGRVYVVQPGPDSGTVGVRGAVVTLIRVGDLPADTSDTLGPGVPGDTMLWSRQGLVALFDSVVEYPDTTLPPVPDTLPPPPPPDTIAPPDTTVPPDTFPPPPPPSLCREGSTLARVRTDRNGNYLARRLPPGIYDILVEPPRRSGLGPNGRCAVLVRAGERTRVDILLWAAPGPDSIPGDSGR